MTAKATSLAGLILLAVSGGASHAATASYQCGATARG